MSQRFVSIGECMVEMSGGEGDRYRLGFAGDTLNTAYYARARLGEDWRVDYVTAVGDDIYSGRMLDFFRGHDIGTDAIRRIAGKRPGLYLIHQDEGDRHFTYWRDTAAARLLADDRGALEEALAGADVLYFSGITLAILAEPARQTLLSCLAAQREAGAIVVFDPNIRPALWPSKPAVATALTQAAGVATIVMPTHSDEVPYFGDSDAQATARRYLDAGAAEVVVKNGAEDARVVTAELDVSVPATAVDKVVDATGAGDSFNGAYMAARLQGATPQEAAGAGHATAAIVIGHHGALVPKTAL